MSERFPSISVLIPQLKSGNESAWNNLCDKFRTALVCKTRFLIENSRIQKDYSPDDLVQETFLKAWKQHAAFRGETTPQLVKWMITILRHTFYDWCKARRLKQVWSRGMDSAITARRLRRQSYLRSWRLACMLASPNWIRSLNKS